MCVFSKPLESHSVSKVTPLGSFPHGPRGLCAAFFAPVEGYSGGGDFAALAVMAGAVFVLFLVILVGGRQ